MRLSITDFFSTLLLKLPNAMQDNTNKNKTVIMLNATRYCDNLIFSPTLYLTTCTYFKQIEKVY